MSFFEVYEQLDAKHRALLAEYPAHFQGQMIWTVWEWQVLGRD